MRVVRCVMYAVVGLVAFAGGAAASDDRGGAKLLVDNDKRQCPSAAYTTIQSAVDAARPGDTILVCPGEYIEQVVIQKPLTVVGIEVANQSAAIIMPPPTVATFPNLAPTGGMFKPAVAVLSTKNVNLSNLTIDGKMLGDNPCTDRTVGVYYGNASGEIEGLAVRFITNGPAVTGCQGGLGIFVQSGVGGKSVVTVASSTVHDYDKNGITGNEVGTNLTVRGNTVSGLGDQATAAQNGIQIGFGARGAVEANAVINHQFNCADPQCSAGIATNVLVFGASGVSVRGNSLGRSQVNVDVEGYTGFATTGNQIAFNAMFDSQFDGVQLKEADNNTVQNNLINDSDEAGVYIDAANNNKVQGNTINEAPCGVQIVSGTNNKIQQNRFLNTVINVCSGSTTPVTSARIAAGVAPSTRSGSAVR